MSTHAPIQPESDDNPTPGRSLAADGVRPGADVGAGRTAGNPFTCPGPFSAWVAGRPAPQGSKHARPIYRGKGTARVFTGKVVAVESSKDKVDLWRQDVRLVAERLWRRAPLPGPVSLRIEFVMPRPASAPKRSTPPHIKRPDLSKLLRSTEDALTSAGVWTDDSVVTVAVISKRYAELDEAPGAWVDVRPLTKENP